jgi:RHS repeat-associated protein
VDAGGNPLTAAYYGDGTDHTVTQNGTTITNNIDPLGRINEQITTVNGTTTAYVLNQYDNDGDSPAWTDNNTTATMSRNISDITGNLAALFTWNYNTGNQAIVYQLSNLQGSIVATASNSTSATGLLSVTPTTEYGVPSVTTANGVPTSTTATQYSWLGAKQRATELPSGIVAMGARVYDPYTGTFTQPDPIQGGGANAYGYTDGDPVNEVDLSGDATCGWAEPWGCAWDAGKAVVGGAEDAGGAVAGVAEDAGGAALDLGARAAGGVFGALIEPLIFPTNLNAAPCEMHNDCGAVFAKGTDNGDGTTTEVKTRATPGADGSTSEHIIVRDGNGDAISVTHRVTNPAGEVVHEHTTQIKRP